MKQSVISARLAVAVAIASALSLGTAYAGTSTATVNVTANVISTCSATTSKVDVAFGAIPAFLAAPQSATGTVTFTCNKGATVGVTVDNGSNFGLGQSGTMRAMKSGTVDYISYHVYQPTGPAFNGCAGTTEWTASLSMSTLWAATGGPKAINICGSVDAAPAVGYAVGASYADAVIVTATY